MAFGLVVLGLVSILSSPEPVRPGLEVLIRDSMHLVAGRRVGLVTNQGGIDRAGAHAVEVLRAAGVNLTALFSPEHGFRGTADPGEKVASTVDPTTGLPIYSLYGSTAAPTDTMLSNVDVLLVDLPDVGTRYYTYISTAIEVMRSAVKHGRRVIILDRPNPISGRVQGNLLDPAFRSFIGPLAVPMRHGMTLGEQARLANRELEIGADLVVVPAQHWTRSMYGDATGIPFVPPSPNLQDLEALIHYPGTCLFEGTALSVGRGTPAAYHQVGAPWLDTTRVLALVRGARLPGVVFEGVGFTPVRPGDAKFPNVALRGIRLRVTDREAYDPTRTAVVMLLAVRAVHPDQIGFIERHFDLLAGGIRLRQAILADRTAESIVSEWTSGRESFETRIRPFLIYR